MLIAKTTRRLQGISHCRMRECSDGELHAVKVARVVRKGE